MDFKSEGKLHGDTEACMAHGSIIEIVEIAYSHYKGSVCTRSFNMGLTSAEGKSWSVLNKRQLIFLSTIKI